jgi:hypothetical protein
MTSKSNVYTYSTPQLASFHGYHRIPAVDNRLEFDIPPFATYTRRDVAMNSQRWEVWLPNSLQVPYLPRRAKSQFTHKPHTNPERRCFDGHLSRFDPTVSPQYYTDAYPWNAFILQTPPVDPPVEFVSVYRVWCPQVSQAFCTVNLSQI